MIFARKIEVFNWFHIWNHRWKAVKMLIHINTNVIYKIVPFEVFVWLFRMSATYFTLYAAKMARIDNFSIPILRQSHHWYTMASYFIIIKMIIHLEKTMVNNSVHLEWQKSHV